MERTRKLSLVEKLLQMSKDRKVQPKRSLADLLVAGKPTKQTNVIDLATKVLQEAGRFAHSDQKPIITLVEPKLPTGLFGGIAKAGPKPRKPAEKKEAVEKLSLALLREMGVDQIPLGRNSKVGLAFRAQGVTESSELDRIVKLPRRDCVFEEYEDLTARFRKPGGTMDIWPIQNAVLHEARKGNGLLGIIAAGAGKTLCSLLVGPMLDAKRIVLFVPPQLRPQLLTKDIPRLNQHFVLPLDRLTVVAYSELSSARSAELLEELKPDLIVCDEAHNFRHRSAARTKRYMRYLKDHPECRVVALSGTITRRSLKDYGHLAEHALRARSPVPHNFATLNEWSEAIDISKDPLAAGALRKLANEEELEIIETMAPIEAQDAVRRAFRRRLVQSPGVVATEEGAVGTSLVLSGLTPIVPAEVKIALNELRGTWCLGGDELVDILSVIRAGCQLSAGFYTRWDWPDGVVDREWLDARSAWNKELREILKLSRKGLDSPLMVSNAIRRGELESEFWGAWEIAKEKYSPEPPRETVWISDFLVQESVRWGKETCDGVNGGIIWFQHRALGEEITRVGGFPFFGGGDKAGEELTKVTPKQAPVIVCSQKAHGTGLNLQTYSRNLFTTPPAGVEAEQTIARTHRPKQEADCVFVDLFVHTEEMRRAFSNSLRDARYAEMSLGQKQKLLYAEKIDLPEEE